MYEVLRKIFFLLSPELAHDFALKLLRFIPEKYFYNGDANPINCMGIDFPHRIGLAAGFDKNGEYLDVLDKLGFAFIEVGTVTPKPQEGNPKPRLYRLPKSRALINRMGFNNSGVHGLINNLRATSYTGILGINIGKNKSTPIEKSIEDYTYCFKNVYPYASYITINISSPNTPGLRGLQYGDYFVKLIKELRNLQLSLADNHKRYVPMALKISPDETDDVLQTMAKVSLNNNIDAIVATNTTCSRQNILDKKYSNEKGGLSGRPLFAQSTHCLGIIKDVVGDEVTLIGVGGVDSVASAQAKIDAGASLVQLYTGLIYDGPSLIRRLQHL